MANGGPSSSPTGPKPRPAGLNLRPSGGSSFAAGLSLDSQRAQERRAADETTMTGDTTLGDTTVGEDLRPSVLGDTPRTYAAQGEDVPPPLLGGGPSEPLSRAMEMERQQRMARTSESLVGPGMAAEGQTANAPSQAAPATGGAATRASGPSDAERQAEISEEEDQGDIAAQQQQDALQQQQAQQRAASQQQANQAMQQAKKQARKKLLDMIKGADVGLSVETVAITLIINLVIWNVQGINKYIFKSELIPEQSFPEDMCCAGCDLWMCFGWLMSPPCFIGPVIMIIALIAYYGSKIAGWIPSILK